MLISLLLRLSPGRGGGLRIETRRRCLLGCRSGLLGSRLLNRSLLLGRLLPGLGRCGLLPGLLGRCSLRRGLLRLGCRLLGRRLLPRQPFPPADRGKKGASLKTSGICI